MHAMAMCEIICQTNISANINNRSAFQKSRRDLNDIWQLYHDLSIGACKRGWIGGRGVEESGLGDGLGVCFVEGLEPLADGGLGEGASEAAGQALPE